MVVDAARVCRLLFGGLDAVVTWFARGLLYRGEDRMWWVAPAVQLGRYCRTRPAWCGERAAQQVNDQETSHRSLNQVLSPYLMPTYPVHSPAGAAWRLRKPSRKFLPQSSSRQERRAGPDHLHQYVQSNVTLSLEAAFLHTAALIICSLHSPTWYPSCAIARFLRGCSCINYVSTYQQSISVRYSSISLLCYNSA